MRKYISMATIFFAIIGCSKEKDTLAGKTFALLPDKTITLSFDAKENRFYGQALNNYFGNYKIENHKITLDNMGMTMMAGPEDEMKKESAYFSALAQIKTYSLKSKQLELKGENVTLTYQEQ